ncbi:MAG: DUF4271 domain-containing protein [Vicingus serpentipes]|nr:DUF4271 domain-containing protein [Vicingus serpentipes]
MKVPTPIAMGSGLFYVLNNVFLHNCMADLALYQNINMELQQEQVGVLLVTNEVNQYVDSTILNGRDSVHYGVENPDKLPVRTYYREEVDVTPPQIEQLFDPHVREITVSGWQTVLLLLAVTLLGLARAFSWGRFKETYKSLYNYRVAQAICNEEKVFFHRVNVLLTINYLIVSALFVYQLRDVLNNINNQITSELFFLVVFGVLSIMFILKMVVAHLLSFVFDTAYLINDYTFTITLFNNLLGVLLIPVLSVMYYTSINFSTVLTYFAVPMMLIIFWFRLVRLFVLGNLKDISYFYIILYICSLEILPLIVLIKIFILG